MTKQLANQFSTMNLFLRFSERTGMTRYGGIQESCLKRWDPPGLWLKPSECAVQEAATGDCAAVLDIIFTTIIDFVHWVRHTDHTYLSSMRVIRLASLGAFMTLVMFWHALTFLYL
jgi:hypothetical protein